MENFKRTYPMVAIFRNKKDTTPEAVKPLNEVLLEIKQSKNFHDITICREFIREGKKDEYDKLKDTFRGFTVCGTFEPTRAAKNLKIYSGFLILDIDKLEKEQVLPIKEKICNIPLTFACFISPSGLGLKIIVEITSKAEQHKTAYKQLCEIYESKLHIPIDRSGSDVSRLCYFTSDCNIYINEEAHPYTPFQEEKKQVAKTPHSPVNNQLLSADAFEKSVQLTNNIYKFEEGSRNNFVHQLACNCNRNGISEAEATSLIKANYNYNEEEVSMTIQSAYKNNSEEFAKFANIAKVQTVNTPSPNSDFLKTTPVIPETLFYSFPSIFKEGSSVFTEERERDVFFIGALAIISGCLPNVKGVYDRQEVFPNLFSFVIAPAASGKGALKFAKNLADEYHSAILKNSKDMEAHYRQEVTAHKQKISNRKKGEVITDEEPAKPAFKVLYIPANTSYAKILFHLEQNEGSGIICETEADTLAIAFKQDWGGYSDMLRKSFHHEKLSSSKKTNNEFIEVNNPRLSIALSGTPNQVAGLIASSEDGLFSRFIFYVFKVEQKWKNVFQSDDEINLTTHFKLLSSKVYQMVQFLNAEETIVCLSPNQWNELNLECEVMLNDVTVFTSEDAGSIVKRLGLILFRIAMIFTALRKFENAEATTKVVCIDEDFNSALSLVKIFLQHSLIMFNNLPKQSEISQFKKGESKKAFIDALPDEFTRKEALEIAAQFQLSDSTVSHLLPKLIGKFFTQIKAGHYKKI